MAKIRGPYVAGFFTDPDVFVKACSASTARAHKRHDAIMPYPVHAAFSALGLKRSLLGRPVLAILLTGAFLGFIMQYWMMKVDWPILIGGKPYNSWPQYVVITFESGILLGAIANISLCLVALCKLLPDPGTRMLKDRCTDDTFALAVPLQGNGDVEELTAFMKEQGAEDIVTYRTDDFVPDEEETVHA